MKLGRLKTGTVFREYAGKQIPMRPRYWKRRFKGSYKGDNNVTIYNFSFLGVWLAVSVEE